jgi:uncharacterized protein involved in exopolysaccharide biosynthesis
VTVSGLADAHGESTLDLVEIWRAIRRGWRLLLLWIAIGLGAGGAVELFWPRSFEGRASVLVRSQNDGGTGVLSRMGVPSEVTGGILGTAIKSPLETELQLLQSRSILGEASDSLGLQVRVLLPAGTPSARVVAPAPHEGSFTKRRYTFEREGERYRVRGTDVETTFRSGDIVKLPVASLRLRDSLPTSFELEILDREDLLKRVLKQLAVQKAGGEVAALVFQWPDSVTAAAFPNTLVSLYLAQRKTVDKGINQRRYEFLTAQSDSLNRQLAQVGRTLRRQQEESGVLDPEVSGKALLEAHFKLREQIEWFVGEQVALNQLIPQVASGRLDARQLAAYPTFLRSQGINDLLSQLVRLEAERVALQQQRTNEDPSVTARTEAIRVVEAQLLPLARTYGASLARQREQFELVRDSLDRMLDSLPGTTETSVALQRDLKRLTQTSLAVQGQRVEARLAAIGEGGEARQVDFAAPSKKPVFPTPVLALGVGSAAGLILGVIAALFSAFLGRFIRTPDDAERAAGVAAAWARPRSALLVGVPPAVREVLVAPLGRGANAGAVAALLAETEQRRENGAMVTEVSALDSVDAAARLSPARAVLFAACAGKLERRMLVEAVRALERAGAPCAGVALHHELG